MRLIWWFLALALVSAMIFLFSGFTALPGGASECSKQAESGARQMKHSHIVQNADLAGQGIAGRVQCSNSSFKQTTWASASCSRDGMQNVAFVSLFVPPKRIDDRRSNSKCGGDLVASERALLGSEKPYSVLQVFVESARLAMPDAQQIILTDPDSEIPAGRLHAEVAVQQIPGNYSRGNLMLQRLESYIEFLETQLRLVMKTNKQKHFIFADSDMIIVGDLGCVFVEYPNFDVALTFRNNKEQPINSGLIFMRGTKEGLTKGRNFIQEVLDTYRRNFMRKSRMMGDQLAFAQVVRKSCPSVDALFKQGKVFEDHVKDVNVLFLPCSSYNWTPAEGAGQFHGMPLDVKVIHFKGSRKRLMLEAWKLHREQIALEENLLPLKCFVLRSGRSKYDF